jgi:hypothetical protein
VERVRNLGISRQLAIAVAIIAVCGALAVGLSRGMDATAIVSFMGVLTALVGALKATEAADTASKTHNLAHQANALAKLTASQNAAIAQLYMAHCGDICPLTECPLRKAPV